MENTSSKNISRRNFLIAAGGLTIGITAYALYPRLGGKQNDDATASPENFEKGEVTAWVHLRSDGQITIFNPAAEMGQGSMTALPVILAEELDADWSKVKIENAPIDPEVYGYTPWGNRKIMLNVGSRTVMGYFDSLREAGAQARYVLLHSVAKKWEVPVESLTTEPSTVVHAESGRKVGYGEILEFLEIPEEIPKYSMDQLKDPKDFRLIGKVMTRTDIPAKANGSAQFAMDVQVPNMLYGVIERGSMHGAKPTLVNENAIRANDGVIEVVQLDHGIGVVATSMEKALAVKKELEIQWDENVPAAQHSSQEAYDEFSALLDPKKEKGRVLTDQGNIKQAFAKADKIYKADFKNDYVYHAQMEPLNAVASVAPDGTSAEIWAGSQGAGSIASAVGEALGIEPNQVKVHPYFLGGGFGRRSLHDYIIEATLLSKAASRPVKLTWTREDDLRYGMYRPMSLQRLSAATDADGNITAFSHYVTGDGSNLLASGAKNEFYDIPNQHLELRTKENGIRLKHWRSVGHGPNKFAIESLIDEVAADQQIDPLEMRRKLMKNAPRALATLEKAAEMANWGSPVPEGRARGIAFGERSGALCTGICEISIDRESGKIKVHHFWSAVDAGIVVQPDNVVAQMEGGILMGMGSVLTERVTIEKGKVQQSNFHDYEILRIQDIPESVDIAIMDSLESPQGIGEASTPIVGGAIANAFAALTGKRLRHLPFTPERVLEALNS